MQHGTPTSTKWFIPTLPCCILQTLHGTPPSALRQLPPSDASKITIINCIESQQRDHKGRRETNHSGEAQPANAQRRMAPPTDAFYGHLSLPRGLVMVA